MIRFSGKIKDIIDELMKLDKEEVYLCEIKEPKSKRSIEQNKMLWQLIHSIAKATHQDDMDVYCGCLERADVLSDYLFTENDIEDELRKRFRGVRFMCRQDMNGKECNVYKVYMGSSKMDTKEMSELIDITMQIASECGIDARGILYE